MGVDRSHPGWKALNDALVRLATKSHALSATVMDEGYAVWGEANAEGVIREPLLEQVERFYRIEIEPRISEMRHGVAIGMQNLTGPDYYVAQSFASIYVAILWYGGTFDVFSAHEALRAALPEIEAITLSLPPWDGPDAGSGAGAKRYA
jgi:hypothetical protein